MHFLDSGSKSFGFDLRCEVKTTWNLVFPVKAWRLLVSPLVWGVCLCERLFHICSLALLSMWYFMIHVWGIVLYEHLKLVSSHKYLQSRINHARAMSCLLTPFWLVESVVLCGQWYYYSNLLVLLTFRSRTHVRLFYLLSCHEIIWWNSYVLQQGCFRKVCYHDMFFSRHFSLSSHMDHTVGQKRMQCFHRPKIHTWWVYPARCCHAS